MTRSLLVLLFFSSSISQAQVYKWVDEQGEVHFGDERHKDAELVVTKAPQSSIDKTEATEAEEVNQRIKSTSEQLARDRKSKSRLQRKLNSRSRQKIENTRKKCQIAHDGYTANEFRWKLTNTQGYKQSQKDAYLIRRDRYKRDVGRYCPG